MIKSIKVILKNIGNQLPYLILIAIYFFFVNLEARKEETKSDITNKENSPLDNKSLVKDKQIRIKIPVIPYEK